MCRLTEGKLRAAEYFTAEHGDSHQELLSNSYHSIVTDYVLKRPSKDIMFLLKKREPSFTASAKGKKVEVNSHYNTHSLFFFFFQIQ